MRKYALLIIDMINDYVTPGGLDCCENGLGLVPAILRLKAAVKEAGGVCVYVNTSHVGLGDPEIEKWGPAAMRGTWGSQICEGLAMEPDDIEVWKRTYDGFFNTELEITLRSLGITDVAVCGVHTHVCVLQTAMGAFYRGFHVIAVGDCMATNRAEVHEMCLPYFQTHVGELTTLAELSEKLRKNGARPV